MIIIKMNMFIYIILKPEIAKQKRITEKVHVTYISNIHDQPAYTHKYTHTKTFTQIE